jgi:hypothetical protein
LRVIALEEHYATQEFFDGPGQGFGERISAARDQPIPGGGGRLVEQLRDLAEGRIAEMDAAGVDVQVLSLTSPGLEQLPAADAVGLARVINDQLAEAIKRSSNCYTKPPNPWPETKYGDTTQPGTHQSAQEAGDGSVFPPCDGAGEDGKCGGGGHCRAERDGAVSVESG